MKCLNKIDNCPNCGLASPPLTLRLLNPHLYEGESKVPDTRTYDVVCLNCDEVVESSKVDNTLIGMKKLRDEMNTLYGKSRIIPPEIGIWPQIEK
ncbi:hypothetical protein LCGC14_1872950 [marine sediment metagenome]|uniref:Uncharacterized protein n=1 Tax=marine sediment metagenome TaxID=412755 RepID=A0A0F9GSI9_9ZZZZ